MENQIQNGWFYEARPPALHSFPYTVPSAHASGILCIGCVVTGDFVRMQDRRTRSLSGVCVWHAELRCRSGGLAAHIARLFNYIDCFLYDNQRCDTRRNTGIRPTFKRMIFKQISRDDIKCMMLYVHAVIPTAAVQVNQSSIPPVAVLLSLFRVRGICSTCSIEARI